MFRWFAMLNISYEGMTIQKSHQYISWRFFFSHDYLSFRGIFWSNWFLLLTEFIQQLQSHFWYFDLLFLVLSWLLSRFDLLRFFRFGIWFGWKIARFVFRRYGLRFFTFFFVMLLGLQLLSFAKFSDDLRSAIMLIPSLFNFELNFATVSENLWKDFFSSD